MAKRQESPQGAATATTERPAKKDNDFARLCDKPLGQSLVDVKREVMAALKGMRATLPLFGSEAKQDKMILRVAASACREIEKAESEGKDGLSRCTVASIVDAIKAATSDGLLIDGRLAYLVPYGNVAKYSPSYIGMIVCARNNGVITDGYAFEVHKNDIFEFGERDGEQFLEHRPAQTSQGAIVGAYAKVILPDGRRRYEFMRLDDLEMVRQKAKSPNSPAYRDYLGQMYRKIVMRRLMKWYASDPFFSAFLANSDDADFANPADLAELIADRPVGVLAGASRTEALAARVSGKKEATPPVETKPEETVTVAADETVTSVASKCAACSGMLASDDFDGQPVMVCTACGQVAQ